MLINGASGTGKTIACLNATCMAMKINDESRVVLCLPNSGIVHGVLQLIKRGDKYIQNVENLLNNLTIITDNKDNNLDF